ncbi:MAG: hypothetical protein J5I93_09090, partial [Pirellulaceae bacterium]|nr:hypothetical protein [Pirellulaceae bacterium]
QDQQNIRNQQTNIVGLRENLVGLREVLRISETNPPTDAQGNPDPTTAVRNQLQIAQARQALFSAEGQLLNQQNGYQATLDSFKFTLGLPPKTCMKVEDPLLDQFNLISTEIGALRDRASDLRVIVATVNSQILDSIQRAEVDGRRVERLPWTPQLGESLAALRQIVADVELVRQQLLRDALPMVETEVDELEQIVPRRQEQLNRLRAKYVQLRDDEQRQRELDCQTRLPADVDPEVTDAKRFAGLVEKMRSQLELRHTELQRIEAPLSQIGRTLDQLLSAEARPAPDELPNLLKGPVLIGLQEQLRRLADQALFTSLIQARSRADRIELVDIDLTSQQAFDIARRFRRDWMNQRAGLVDQWRLIEFNADNLEGFANVVAAGDISNQGQNPLKFRGTRGHLRFGLQFAAPYTRLQERNTYRQSLIEYQQARRSYYRYVDQVSQGLRGTIRQVELNQLNFEARRVALLASINQVELTSEIQTLTGERGQAQSPTAARDIVSALGDLRNAQNDFLSVWVNYEVLRRTLDFNLGTMQLDDRGLWIDPGPIGPDHGSDLPYAEDACPDLFLAPFLSSPLVDESMEALPWGEEVLPPGQAEEQAPAQPADEPPAAGSTLPLPPAPADALPADAVPAQSAPAETVPAETVPADVVPADAVPAESPLLPEPPAAPPLGPPTGA